MLFIYIGILLFIISILILIYSFYSFKNIHRKNEEIDELNKTIEEKNKKLSSQQKQLENNYNSLSYSLDVLKNNIENKQEQLKNIQDTIISTAKAKEEMSEKAFSNYCEVLEKQYEEKEQEYDQYRDALETAYSNRQIELMQELAEVQQDLDKVKSTRAAAIKAQTREKEISEKLSFYCLNIAESELRDIEVLESIKSKLANPRILSMLIWQTFWQKPLNRLIADVVGTSVKGGIYKITNIKTKECYIGQAVTIQDRWKQHCKCACGIDTPAGNKLYKAMQEYGIQNFSWEILEEVPPALLNEKEKYYIELYDSYNFGYNSNQGISK